MLSLAKICAGFTDDLSAELHGDGSVLLERISTDTRSLKPGDVFIALRGPNHDGHDHIDAAIEAGACALIIESSAKGVGNTTVPSIVVSDSRLALGRLALLWCAHLTAQRVAVTGSNGKTTVKEMIASILTQAAGESGVHATRGNFNNDIGLPLTCLEIGPQHRFAVLEMGANAVGEISYLSGLARPSVALVTSIAAAHLEGFGSIADIAREKASIFGGVDESGVAVFPADSAHIDELTKASSHCRHITFGFAASADVVGSVSDAGAPESAGSSQDAGMQRISVQIASDLDSSLAGADFTVSLQLLGQHNRLNALAAIACCSALDVSVENIVAGLAALQPVPGRLQLRTGLPARLIDDTYNANPASLNAAIDLLAAYGGKRVLVLGDMKELGAAELQFHAEAGRYARESGIDCLVCVGELAAHAASEFGENSASFTEKAEVAELLRRRLGAEHTVLFKGSRGARMEEIIELLLEPSTAGSGRNPPSSGGVQSTSNQVGGKSSTANSKTRPPAGSADFRQHQNQTSDKLSPVGCQFGQRAVIT